MGITTNTVSYHNHIKAKKPIKVWRDRSKYIRTCGVCFNLVFLEKKVPGCPLHPKLNRGVDLREQYCEIDHLCKAAYLYNGWNDKQRKKFIKFLKKKNLDWYSYSIKMDDDSLIAEFLASSTLKQQLQ